MSYVKCEACPTHADCVEAGMCLNTLVTHKYGVIKLHPAPRADAPLMCGSGYSGTMPAVVPAAPAAPQTAPRQSQGATRPAQAPQRPAAGTTTGKVWTIADDELSKGGWDRQSPSFRKHVIALCEQAGINSSTASVQFGKWRAVIGV